MLNRHFSRQGGDKELFVEEVQLSAVAREFLTPTYVYSKAAVTEAFDSFSLAFQKIGIPSLVCVSVKTNSNLSLLSLLSKKNAGFEVVSGGELKRVFTAGGDPKKVVFAGVGKTDEEIRFALTSGILMLNVESREELLRIQEIADTLQKNGLLSSPAPVALRVNPDIDAKTHPYISTGLEEHKFGIPLPEAMLLYSNPSFQNRVINFVGVHCHLGSMVTELDVFREAFKKLGTFVQDLNAKMPTLRFLDIGGGLGVSYRNDIAHPAVEDYAAIVVESFRPLGLDLTLLLEPGRFVFANAAVLLTKVLFQKQNSKKQFTIVDAGFNDLIRPTLYQAYHEIEPVKYDHDRKQLAVDVVGPICESSDCFAKGRVLPELKRDDLVVIHSTGAYGFSMASNYNTRPRPAEVLICGNKMIEIRPRESVESLYQDEIAALKRVAGRI